jgi:FKBP-type peptidyl-prolyl cis-trans isomerase FklB
LLGLKKQCDNLIVLWHCKHLIFFRSFMHIIQQTGLFIATSLISINIAQADKKKVTAMKTEQDKVSYILGHQIGSDFKNNNIQVNPEFVLQGMKEAQAGTPSAINPEETRKIMTSFQEGIQKARKTNGEKSIQEGKKFLEENSKKTGVVTLPSGLQYKVVTEGKGEIPKDTDKVEVHYRGKLINGKEFDSSYGRGTPAEFGVTQVIKGWTEALKLMKTGSKWEVYIPGNLAYGENGAGKDIGPNETLIFDVELLSIKK